MSLKSAEDVVVSYKLHPDPKELERVVLCSDGFRGLLPSADLWKDEH